MKRLRFKDIVQWLPDSCPAVQRYRTDPAEFDGQEVLYMEGDVQATAMDLATWGRESTDGPVATIVIDGSLRADLLFNLGTTPCPGLFVLGDMDVGHAVVSGQEMFVGGQMRVQHLFWGDGPHGSLAAPQGIAARLVMATRRYRLPPWSVDQNRQSQDGHLQVRLQDQDDRMDNEADVVARYFKPDLLNPQQQESCSFADVVDRPRVIAAVQSGQGVLLDTFVLSAPTVVARMWGDGHFSTKALLQAQKPHWTALLALLPPDKPQEKFRSQHDDTTIIVRRKHQRSSDGRWEDDLFCVLTDDGVEIQMHCPAPVGIQRTLGLAPQLQADYKHPDAGQHTWRSVFKNPAMVALLSDLWDETLRRAEASQHWRAHMRKTVTPKDLLALLDLPVVQQQYNEWKNPQRNGFWDGHLRYIFHPPTAAEPWAILRIARERKDTSKPDVHAYDFYIDNLDGATEVKLRYKSSQHGMPLGWDEDPYCQAPIELSLFDGHKVDEALRWFDRCRKRLPLRKPQVAAQTTGV